MSLSVVILAAGQGARMHSALPKMLHKLAGKPLLEHILRTVTLLKPHRIVVVYGHKGAELKSAFAHFKEIIWVEQAEQLGTGHAALQALPFLKANDSGKVLLLPGDNPLIQVSTLKRLIAETEINSLALITQVVDNPVGLGRIIRNSEGDVVGIVEEKDASTEQKRLKEINSGIYCVANMFLNKALPTLTAHNAQQDYYLTDMIALAVAEHHSVHTVFPDHVWEVQGVNDKIQLAALERIWQKNEASKWMVLGLTLMDPMRFDVRGDVSIGHDVIIDSNVILEGTVTIGNHVEIGPNTIIKDSVILDHVVIKSHCVIDNAIIGKASVVGPFARLRPGTELKDKVHIGNFVEIKNTQVGTESKINHLSYMGDSVIGSQVNVGAGVITCNYDGKLKHQTVIGDHAFIGSDVQLIAPVTIGAGVTVGAGTTITKDVPENYLIHNHVQHRSVEKKTEIKG